MNNSKAAIVVSQILEKVEKVVGLCWAGFFLIAALVATFDNAKDGASVVVIMWLLTALGFFIFMAGRKRAKMRLAFKKYVPQLSSDPFGSLENLAASTGTSIDVVKRNLKYMIKKKFFTDAFINEQTNQLVFPAMAQRERQTSPQPSTDTTAPVQAESVALTCPYCGGINKVTKGSVAECDFCGSLLQG